MEIRKESAVQNVSSIVFSVRITFQKMKNISFQTTQFISWYDPPVEPMTISMVSTWRDTSFAGQNTRHAKNEEKANGNDPSDQDTQNDFRQI